MKHEYVKDLVIKLCIVSLDENIEIKRQVYSERSESGIFCRYKITLQNG